VAMLEEPLNTKLFSEKEKGRAIKIPTLSEAPFLQ